ncbi:GH36-type glycosyl hydrolase domain-containing protein [Hydrogenophaga sp.]|uniref:GH36-type glycosyl hydrolase domain-containing protein n=1 Tax=Hydrogenophaga sp. TaxID=1904254 RepID=UPI002731BA11|nr:glucoamylase family protein [Hydrogenophaga sp.]MDP2019100.1 glucoamylase family protein [Hydrogenophaga sp.]
MAGSEQPGQDDWVPQPVRRMLDAGLGPALEPIRSEIFGLARFEQHGRSLAASHHAARAVFGSATFYPRLQSNIQSLRTSYEHIASHAHSGRDISPGAEWLFDNFHLIEDQLREIHEGLPARYYRTLPVLQDAPLKGLPRIYSIAWAFVAHTDGAFDETLLCHFLNAYQEVHELSHGELWALPTTLRVVQVENLRRLADRIASHKAARELAGLIAHRIDDLELATVREFHALAERRGVNRVFLCHLAQNLAGHRPPTGGVFLTQLRPWLQETVPDLAALQAQHHADQAADHLSVGNAVTALRLIGAADWSGVVARTSRVMQAMLTSSVFAAEDDATRSTTLHGIERLAAQSQRSETAVAQALLALMAGCSGHQALAGHWLVGGGRAALEQSLGLSRRARGLGRLVVRMARVPTYLTVMLAGSLGLVAAVYALAAIPAQGWMGQTIAALVLLLMVFPASEAVVAVVNRLISESARPAHLPRFLLADGIPAQARVMVVMPVLLGRVQAVAPLVHRLHLHFLANTEAHAQFALLSDFSDADSPHLPGDDAVLAEAVAQLSALNENHPVAQGEAPRFVLLHRERTLSTTQGRWIGWERKRGKLEQLVAALVNEAPGPFVALGELSRMAQGTRYLLTLDSDTQLPPGRLRALVGVAEHPDNQPRLDASGRRVVQGYGILQPRVVPPLPQTSLTSPWQWMSAGQRGLDPYSAMSSDVYQDVFGEGSFTGKGLLHVATMHAVLGERLPEDRVLSHDLLECALERCAVVTDITLIEPDPEHADVAASRLHRWTRGDWQLLPFLLQPRRWQLSPINRLKLLENLRRSLVTPASLLLLLLSMWGVGLSLGAALWLAVAAQAAAPLLGAFAGLVPHRASLVGERFARAAVADGLRALLGGVWHIVQLLQQALRASDAVLRTGWRMAVSRRQLLAWTTADAASAALRPGLWPSLRRHALETAVALPLLAWLWLSRSEPPALAVALLVLWALAPLISWLAHQPWPGSGPRPLIAADRALLDDLARDTWRLFERCVDAQNHFLPPDNLQILPFDTVAHRTSPTNIGLYLLSTSCARELGWIGTQDLLQRMEATLASLQQMARHRGHFLNWYDTETLQPLLPRYVSTVDSGNLSVHLLAVAQACRQLARDPHATQATAQALQRTQARLAPALLHQKPWLETALHQPLHQTALGQVLQTPLPDPLDAAGSAAFATLLDNAAQELERIPHPRPDPRASRSGVADEIARDHDSLHALLSDHLATLRSVSLDRSAAAEGGGPRATRRLLDLAGALEQLAWAPEFGFLYHPKRHLLHIGFRLDDQALDASFYDLLASESRSTSLLAIAKGDVPMKHWAALGRPLFANGRHAVLRSWSGSMFEYLMPTLLMAEPHGSVLREAGCSALMEQIAHAQGKPMPWGMSESAYAGRDHTLAYQYAPQGVPRLALRRTPLAEQVIAPYATALATQVNARLACQNLSHLASWSARGRYGFIEALDFTVARQTQGGTCTPVGTYMAHHQGMTIVALTNVLRGGIAQRWGMAHPNLEAVSSLLHERAPRALSALVHRQPPNLSLNALQRRAQDHVRSVVPGAQALEPTHLLSNGRYSVSLRANGAGWSQWGATGITRWRDDALRDACGSFVYVRLEHNATPVSVSSHPAPDPAASYQSTFHTDRVVLEAQWSELRAQTTVWVSPEDDIELRRVVLTNRSDAVIELELISAFDVTLARAAADEAHPAFSNFFVKADWLADQQALRFVRTPRLQTESTLQAAHFVADVQGDVMGLRCQTDRGQWLGRNHSTDQPLARMVAVPAESTALETGLDPVAALGVMLRLLPGAQACVTFATAASDHPAQLLAIVDKYRQSSSVERASVMSATLASIQVAPGRPRMDYLPAFQSLTTALLMTLPKVDLPVLEARARRVCDRRSLWQLGISGDRPMVLVSAGSPQGLGLLRSVVQALREWSRAGVACDVVVLSSEAHSYQMPLQRELALLHEQLHALPMGGATGGLHLLRPDALSAEQLSTLDALARIHLRADGRSWTEQIKTWSERFDAAQAPLSGSTIERIPTHAPSAEAEPSVGVFEAGGRRFAFEVSSAQRPQRPWINVLANPGFGAIVSESGGGNTWAGNSRLNQLTAWANDPVADTPAEWFLLQDRRTHAVWSLTPSSWGDAGANHRVVHAQGRTTISHRRGDLDIAVHWSVDAETAVKQVRIEIVNRGRHMAHLRTVALVEWLMGEKRSDRATLHTSRCLVGEPMGIVGLMCTQTDATAGWGGGTAFLVEALATPGGAEGLDWTCDRAAFFDAQGQMRLPQRLGQRQGGGLDPCAALSRPVTVRPGATLEQVYLLGFAASSGAARELAVRAMQQVPREREEAAKARWDALLGATTVVTPDPLFDAMTNRWLLYQTVSSRLWAKAGFYQAGGATGYRDQLQDTMALTWAAPRLLRDQIVLCASRQFEAGDVQHWWHSPGGAGVRTHFSDDLLWLPFACSHYLQATGDAAVLDETVPFLEGVTIPLGAEDAYDTPRVSETRASVYEHAARTIDHSLPVGTHGLPLMGSGDWNDGMNRVGHEGRGESVWMAWFLCTVVRDWIPLARARGEHERAARWEAALHGWNQSLETNAWDGDWYRRAFFDDGSPLGSRTQAEGRIDLIAQAWSVLSGQAPLTRQRLAMEAVESQLVNADAGLIQLLAPPLAHAQPSAGYIQAYPPGVRENGGQYAHAGVWGLMAMAALAVREPAESDTRDAPYRYFTYLSPAHRSHSAAWGLTYGLEPYAMAADVYSQPPYVGRGGWSWYTGAAGWLHRAAIESILGLKMTAHDLSFSPCLPAHWPRAEITLVRDGRTMRFVLVRQSAEAVRASWGSRGVGFLEVGEHLAWASLPPNTVFVIPLEGNPTV